MVSNTGDKIFTDYVSHLIDSKLIYQPLIEKETTDVGNEQNEARTFGSPLSLTALTLRVIDQNLQNSSKLSSKNGNLEVQTVLKSALTGFKSAEVLNTSQSFKEWIDLRDRFRSHSLVENAARELLKAKDESFAVDDLRKGKICYNSKDKKKGISPEEKWLGILFDELVSKSTNQEKNELVAYKNKTASAIEASSYRIRVVANKIQDVIVKVLKNDYFRFTAGLVLALVTFFQLRYVTNLIMNFVIKTILPQLIAVTAQYLPLAVKNVIVQSTKIYLLVWVPAFLLTVSLTFITPKRFPKVRKALQVAYHIIGFPIMIPLRLLVFNIECAVWCAKKIINKSHILGTSWEKIHNMRKDRRLKKDLNQARKIWIQVMKMNSEATEVVAELKPTTNFSQDNQGLLKIKEPAFA